MEEHVNSFRLGTNSLYYFLFFFFKNKTLIETPLRTEPSHLQLHQVSVIASKIIHQRELLLSRY